MTQNYSYQLGPRLGVKATLGLIVLQSDETIEHDMHRLLPSQDVALYVTRVPSAPDVSKQTLVTMVAELPAAAALLPPPLRFDVVAYGCTSGSSVIGPDRIAELLHQGCATDHVSEPVSALVAACQAMGVSRLAILSPYVEEVSSSLRAVLLARGIDTPVFGSFNEAAEAKVARIDRRSLTHAAIDLARHDTAEAVFLSCTNLRTLEVISEIETAIGKPVLTSNQVLAWHMAQLAGIDLPGAEFGQLMKK